MDLIDNISLGHKQERDIDFLLAEEFSVSPNFARWFLRQTTFREVNAQVCGVFRSKSHYAGESDLIVIYERASFEGRFAFLIENKITAPFQPGQLERYRMRVAEQVGRQNGDYAAAEVLLCAPARYKNAYPKEAGSFDTFVSYEDIALYFNEHSADDVRSAYRSEFIKECCSRKVNVAETIYSEATDSFWASASDLARNSFPELEMRQGSRYAHGTNWVTFRPTGMPSLPKKIKIEMKGNKGHVDLTFDRTVCGIMQPLVKPILEDKMQMHKAGRSSVIRLCVDPFTVSEQFDLARERVVTALRASSRLLEFYLQHREELNSAAQRSTPLD